MTTKAGARLDPDDESLRDADAHVHDDVERQLASLDEMTRRRVEEWAKRLVDLSRRNRLLNFRSTKRTTLKFIAPEPEVILQALLREERFSRGFYRPPELPPLLPGQPREVSDLADELELHPPEPRELATDQRDPAEIDKSLAAIDRRARAEFEDRGTHVLHLVWGFVAWTDEGSGEPQRAPVVLVPMELARKSINDPYELRAAPDGDPILNPALRVKLEAEFDRRLPDLDVADSSPEEIEAQVMSSVPPTWKWEPHAAIGIFSFAKEAMYRDLVAHGPKIQSHPIVRSMVRGGSVPELDRALQVPVPQEEELDGLKEASVAVVDADSSQRRAVEAARRGLSFVLVGPPGTGKSQTITNIIADAIASGKSVLFVSEKMAALEVVARRLEAVDLRGLVLELHSAKASRSAVARGLKLALDTRVALNDGNSAQTRASLDSTQAQLNGYVDALHRPRELGLTAHEVMGRLAQLSTAPLMAGPSVPPGSATLDDLGEVDRAFRRLADAWLPVEEGHSHPWGGINAPISSPAERDAVQDQQARTHQAVRELERLDLQITRMCEWPVSHSQDERRARSALGRLLNRRSSGPREWLSTDDLTTYDALLGRWSSISREHGEHVAVLQATFGEDWRSLSPTIGARIGAAAKRLDAVLGSAVNRESVIEDRSRWEQAAAGVRTALDDVLGRAQSLGSLLGVDADHSAHGCTQLIRVARMSQQRHRPSASWLSRARLAEAEAFMASHSSLYTAQRVASTDLFERYDPTLLDLDLDVLIERMGRAHRSRWSRFRPAHRADLRTIAGVSRSRTVPSTVMGDLDVARRVRDGRSAIADLQAEAGEALGEYARGPETDVRAVREALDATQALLELPAERVDWDRVAGRAVDGTPYDPEIERSADALERAMAALGSAIRAISTAADADRESDLLAWEAQSLLGWIGDVEEAIGGFMPLIAELEPFGIGGAPTSVQTQAMKRARIDELEESMADEDAVLSAVLREEYRGFDTDWERLHAAATWSSEARSAYGGPFPDDVARRVVDDELDALPWSEYEAAVDYLDDAATKMSSLFTADAGVAVHATLTGTAAKARTWLDDALLRIEDLAVWHEFHEARESVAALRWDGFANQCIERAVPREQLANAASRAWLESWLRGTADADPHLGSFRRAEHERAIDAFRQADSQQIKLGREHVLRKYEGRIPAGVVPGSEQSLVNREGTKIRRHMSVRALLGSLPTLLPKLKPCLMMSPLSVSHYLGPDMEFDLVVFDEASQVTPEDAVNCIYRGRQLIVAGDPRQLPPTSFFKLSASAESDDDVESDIGDFESVLDVCGTIGLPSFNLEWHYRSRHDALIAFSNHYIYEDRLVTFPAPYQNPEGLGVRLVHVPDAVYERGRTASNPTEAARVVEVVLDHWQQHPDQSIGVVAFSVAQENAVIDALEQRLRDAPDLERFMGRDRLDNFFVKNLETVQGDERDVIVFTIGYGPDAKGRVSNNFGALNRSGGARRLNVAITRAKRQVIVVSSMRAQDIHLPPPAAGAMPSGPTLLREYLKYAELGDLPEGEGLHGQPGLAALESDVAQTLRSAGVEIVERVGTSRYRVDLGVLSRREGGRIVLGIEFDGPMYRDARTARDRDRLRHEILLGLGWTTVRVWAPDWIRQRETEIKRLSSAIEEAEERLTASPSTTAPAPHEDEPATDLRTRMARPQVALDGPAAAVALGWAVPYPRFDVPRYTGSLPFYDRWRWAEHADRIAKLVAAEGPVQEEYIAYRLARAATRQRAGSRIRQAVIAAVALAEKSGHVERRGSFIWPAGASLEHIRVPVKGEPETRRDIEQVPPEELDLAILRVTETAGTIDQDQLLTAVARIFGFERKGGRIQAQLGVRVSVAIRAGKLVIRERDVALGPNADLPPVASLMSAPSDGAGRVSQGSETEDWVRHPSFGVCRVVERNGSTVTIDHDGERRRISTSKIDLVPVPPPA